MAVRIDATREGGGHEGRGLILDDHGWSAERRAGLHGVASYHCGSDELTDLAVEHRLHPLDRSRTGCANSARHLDRALALADQHQHPGQRLDAEVRDRAAIDLAVLLIEQLLQGGSISISVVARRQFDVELVALAAIAHVGEAALDK